MTASFKKKKNTDFIRIGGDVCLAMLEMIGRESEIVRASFHTGCNDRKNVKFG